MENKISIDDFKKIEIKIGQILNAEKVDGSDKLLKLSVDFGSKQSKDEEVDHPINDVEEKDIRQIISGISSYFSNLEDLIGKKCAFATNLEPRVIRGLESNGMILAVSDDNSFSLLEVSKNITPGLSIK